MNKNIDEFLENIKSLDESKIVRFPNRVLLCGGNITQDATLSFRKYIKEHDVLQNYMIPEDIKNWRDLSIYQDLLTFEEDLGSLISLVVLFLESDGSLAELGAFSKMQNISNKLLTIVDTKHYEEDSFIKLGPITYLENKDTEKVIVFSFLENQQTDKPYQEHLNTVTTKINALKALEIKKTIEKANVAHISLIIYEIISYFGILSSPEVRKIFKKFELDFSIFPKCVLLLNALGLVYEHKYISTKYYTAVEFDQYIRFSFYEYIDKAKFLYGYREELKADMENDKRKALNEFEKRS